MPETVRFGVIPNPFGVAAYAALRGGCFEAEGIQIESTTLANGQAVAEALATHAIDCGVGGHLQTLEAVTAGHLQAFIGPLAFEEAPANLCICLVAARSTVRSAKDLEGQAVAFSARSAMSELQLRIFMATGGADFESVRLCLMPFRQMGQALRNGQVSAASIVEPFATQLVESGTVRVIDRGSLSTSLAAGQRVLITGLVASRSWLDSNPASAAAVARAVASGVDMVHRDASAARQIIADMTGVAAELVARVPLPAFHNALRAADLQRVYDLAAAFGMLEGSIPARALIARLD